MLPWFHVLAGWCKETCLDLIGSRQSQRRQIRALRHLDDRLLCDIGLTRRGIRLSENMPNEVVIDSDIGSSSSSDILRSFYRGPSDQVRG